jgi:hypothetical protein
MSHNSRLRSPDGAGGWLRKKAIHLPSGDQTGVVVVARVFRQLQRRALPDHLHVDVLIVLL